MPARKRASWKKYIMIISFICGVLYFAEVRYGFFRLKDMEIILDSAIPEEIIWQALPREAVDFWPYLAFNGHFFTEQVTDYYPVSISLSLTGWGRYKVTVEPREIFLSVSWNSKLWLLSSDGMMWLANLPAAALVKGLKYPTRPILAWDSQLPVPIDTDHPRGNIYTSSLPIEKIKKWYDTVEKIYWKNNIYCLLAKKIEGRPIVQILLGSEGRISGEILLKDDASDWLSVAAALENIYPSASGGMPHGLAVNATYNDTKMVVSEKGKM